MHETVAPCRLGHRRAELFFAFGVDRCAADVWVLSGGAMMKPLHFVALWVAAASCVALAALILAPHWFGL
jgi:hypothetical protein